MTTRIIRFDEISEQDRKIASPLPKFAANDRVELRVRREGGEDQTLPLPPSAIGAIDTLLSHLLSGRRVAVLAEEQEISPAEASTILGISRPLVVHRMDVGDLPFRYVGKHRRAKLRDVLALKADLDKRQAALTALAEDTEDLIQNHGL